MKSIAFDLDSPGVAHAIVQPATIPERLAAYLELTKPRITFLIVLTSAAGFCLASREPPVYSKLAQAMFGVALLSSGIAAINQYMERDLDALMRRTASRPLPAGKLSPFEALLFGLVLTAGAECYLAVFSNLLTAALGLAVVAGYLCLYTPLKTRTTLSTVVGAFPGAVPPLIGWTASRGEFGVGGWVLFAILFLWQFPHFLAIALLYREDYGRAGILMLPVVEPEGRITRQQIVVYTIMLIPVSLLPTLVGISGVIYFYSALLLSTLFLYSSIRVALSSSRQRARSLLLASVVYLPLLFTIMVVDR